MSVDTNEIRRRRKRQKLTLAKAAKLAGWKSAQHWANVEQGRQGNMRVATLVAVAKVLGCKVDALLKK